MNPALKWALISFGCLLGVALVVAILVPLFMPFRMVDNHLLNRDAERDTVQTAIQSLMVDSDLSRVTPSTSGAGGEKITSTSTQFHPTLNLQAYWEPSATQFCYRWSTDGRITFQYDYDDAGNCAANTDQLYQRIR